MKLVDLLSVLPKEQNPFAQASRTLETDPRRWLEVTDLTVDSRRVQEGAVFIAIRGTKFDSHRDLEKVCAAKPAAVVVEHVAGIPGDYSGAIVQVENTRRVLAALAARFFGDPSLHFFTVGVTGTNGKTSCTFLLEHILEKIGLPTAVIGTIHHRLQEHVWPTDSTTPGSIQLQSRLNEMRGRGARALAMEVSSHALDQFRADSIHFNAVIFTNLTRDHLDYHPDMESYFLSKQRLFTDLLWESRKGPLVAAVNGDDPWGRRLRVAFPAEVLTYGTGARNDFMFRPLQMGFAETTFLLKTPFGERTATIPLCGRHNLYNVVGCLAALTALGVSPDVGLRALETFQGVPGRLQPVSNNRGLSVFIDYAHSPDALENVLKALRQVREEAKLTSKITVVFGCGGDRDKGKRPLMAKVAETWADSVVVTSDNPRTESPERILREIEAGFSRPPLSILDRREAIGRAIQQASRGDVILIAGKGHEDYQIIGETKSHFSDFEVAREFLK